MTFQEYQNPRLRARLLEEDYKKFLSQSNLDKVATMTARLISVNFRITKINMVEYISWPQSTSPLK